MLVAGLIGVGACGSEPVKSACGDGRDNDQDQLIDLADPGCVGDLRQTSELDPPPGVSTSSVRTSVDTPPGTPNTTPGSSLAVCQVNGVYDATGVDGARSYTRELSACETAIVAGYQVDGVAGGVYEMICGPTTFTREVSDGFLLILSSKAAPAEFDSRLRQAEQRGWAHEHVTRC